ncbi:hypothetical protein ACIPW5_11370 [Streptomyces sp. NPDC090077]|uniref:hypothetical protein n=1 Tax=Streptomyces sp. NPDC090077 TaxID=3365938 RepID=UPI00381F2E6E
MEVLLAACLLAWAAGAQSEQARLGISPAERDLRRERVRHEKAVRKIADKHGTDPAESDEEPLTIPEAFRSGYRRHTPMERVATPAGRHLGNWTARGVYWARDTGRSALKEYRRRRKAEGAPDPAPVIAPPVIPPTPTEPPTAGLPGQVVLTKPVGAAGPAPVEPVPAAPAPDPAPAPGPAPSQPEAQTAPDPIAVPAPREPEPPAAPPEAVEPAAPTTPAQPSENGVGRMASEVTYESVRDESEELSLMCEDDLTVYDRLQQRCEREISRADELIAALRNAGAGDRVIGWVTRCMEQYQLINSQLGHLKQHTYAQDEAVMKAKKLLEAGQGVYAGIAADMESVAERPFYVSDAVDAEDTAAHSEAYETTGA